MKYPDKNQGSIPHVPQEKKWKSVGLIQIDRGSCLTKEPRGRSRNYQLSPNDLSLLGDDKDVLITGWRLNRNKEGCGLGEYY